MANLRLPPMHCGNEKRNLYFEQLEHVLLLTVEA